jgi:threonine/homoserine/homoserine lactone efflux protein
MAIIAESSTLFHVIRYVGGFYLIWMAYRFWKESATFSVEMEESLALPLGGRQKKSSYNGLKAGFLINILNPYILLFHFGTFTAVLPRTTPLSHKSIYAGSLILISLLWFILISIIFSNRTIRGVLSRHREWTDGITTLILVFFGCRIIFYWGMIHNFQGNTPPPSIKIIRMGASSAAGKKP